MSALASEKILSVHHWNDTLFSFRTTRDPGLRFINGQFVMIGLEVNGRPLTRAYSIASANHEEYLEFFSIKVANGPLTSRLQHLQPGDPIVNQRPIVARQQRPNLSRWSGCFCLFLALFEAEGIVAGFQDVAVVGDAVE
jgi:NAD(P)H-flavin reductase